MNHRHACGLAALCLFALLPRASALTITHSETFALSNSHAGSGSHPLNAQWYHPLFNPGLGTLERVVITAAIDVTVTAIDLNYYGGFNPQPRMLAASVSMSGNVSATAGYAMAWTPFLGSDAASNPATLVNVGQAYSITAPLSITHTGSTQAQADLDRFSGQGTWPHGSSAFILSSHNVSGTSTFGSLTSNGTVSFTIDYHYRVSEGGSSFVMLSFAFALFGVIRRMFHGRAA